MTLVGSSIFALLVGIGAALQGNISINLVDHTMTKYSVPWFVLWYLFCRTSSQVIIHLKQPPDKGEAEE